MTKDALVKNASDKEQVKAAARKERDQRKQELSDLKAILALPEGRRLLWRMLEQCKTFASIWRQSAEIHYLAGKQDLGHFIMSEIIQADDEAFLQMMRENQNGDS